MANKISVQPIWKHEECFIIGGGPSVKDIPNLEELLKDKNVIGVNDAYQFSCTDICIFGDKVWYDQYKDRKDFKEFKGDFITVAPGAGRFTSNIKYIGRKSKGISLDPSILAFNKNTGAAAINLALLLGCKIIHLIGFDMKPRITKYFPDAKVINCNLDSALECFAKLPLGYCLRSNEVSSEDKPASKLEPVIITSVHQDDTFNIDHLPSLMTDIENNTTIPYTFQCLQDKNIQDDKFLSLEEGLPCNLSSLEAFKHVFYGPVTYIDVNTRIIGNIDNIIDHNETFSVIHGTTDIIQWDGDFRRLWYDDMVQWKDIMSKKELIVANPGSLLLKALLNLKIGYVLLNEQYDDQICHHSEVLTKDCRIVYGE